MEETDQRKTLRMKYAKRWSFQSQEDITCNSESTGWSGERLTMLTQERTRNSLAKPDAQNIEEFSEKIEKLQKEIDTLKLELQQKIIENQAQEAQKALLQEKTANLLKRTKDQDRQLFELTRTLEGKNKEYDELKGGLDNAHLLNQSVVEQEKKFSQLKEAILTESCTFEELLQSVVRMKEEYESLTVTLNEEIDKVAVKVEENSALNKLLLEEQKVAKDLEIALSEEAAKSKKLEGELKFLINNVNVEKQELKDNFDSFVQATTMFLEEYDKHRDAILVTIERETEGVF